MLVWKPCLQGIFSSLLFRVIKESVKLHVLLHVVLDEDPI